MCIEEKGAGEGVVKKIAPALLQKWRKITPALLQNKEKIAPALCGIIEFSVSLQEK